MKPFAPILAALGIVFVSAAGAPAQSPVAPAAQSADALPTEDFVRMVAIGDMFEIQSSKMAVDKARDETVKRFARMMIEAHQKTSAELKSTVEAAQIKAQIPSTLDQAHKLKFDQLRSAAGDRFDATYGAMQVEAHQQAITVFENYARAGADAKLKEWAEATLPTLKQHLEEASKLRREAQPSRS